ncbi:MAG: hypothetical protein EOM24_21450 [Chloroflexia bacterium]|nr:hypothetical protein [Chloroflexia bacterium]
MTRAFAKSDRIGQVERLLLTSRVPLSQAEIARRCEVHRSTIGRLVQGMEVLEPATLREQIIGEVRRQMRRYGINDTDLHNRQRCR